MFLRSHNDEFKKNIQFVFIVLVVFSLTSCSYYPDKNKPKWKDKISRNFNDSIYLSNYVFARVYEEDYTFMQNKFEIDTFKNDSIFELFKTSLNKLNLPVSYEEVPLNKFDKEIYRTNSLHKIKQVREIPPSKIIELANEKKGKLNLLPIITLQTMNTMDGFYKNAPFIWTRLTISIYIIKDDKIVFFKSQYRETSLKKYENWNKDEGLKRAPISLTHWDKLLESLMGEISSKLQRH